MTYRSALPAHAPRTAAVSDGDRAAFLEETCHLLWPQAGCDAHGGATEPVELLVLPSRDRPRLLAPASRRAAAAAVRGYGEPRSARALWGSRGLALLLRAGVVPPALGRITIDLPAGAATIERYLADRLGRELRVSMYLGAPRANRKPVLRLLSPRGELLGVAKLGVSPLARELVLAEQRALQMLAGHRFADLVVPQVLHVGEWRQLPVLVLSPLPVGERRVELAPGRLSAAMRQLATCAGVDRLPLQVSPYWTALQARLERAPESPDREALAAVLAELDVRAGQRSLPFAAWHGDWTPWNMAATRAGLLLWDWERFAPRVPLGFDALHHRLQTAIVPGGTEPVVAATACAAGAVEQLHDFELGERAARLTGLLYLAELASRQLADRQAAAGARLGAVGGWLLPALQRGVEVL